MHKLSKNKWIALCQKKLFDISSECDSCAAIEGPISSSDLSKIRKLCNDILDIFDKYSK